MVNIHIKKKISIIQGQITSVLLDGFCSLSNSSKILCLQILCATLVQIDWEMRCLSRLQGSKQQFSIIQGQIASVLLGGFSSL